MERTTSEKSPLDRQVDSTFFSIKVVLEDYQSQTGKRVTKKLIREWVKKMVDVQPSLPRGTRACLCEMLEHVFIGCSERSELTEVY